MLTALTAAIGWGYWPANVTLACGAPDLIYANGSTAVGNGRYLSTTHWMNGFEVYNRYGYFETSGVPADLSAVPVVRVIPPHADFAMYGDGAETEIVWFYHQPGSLLTLNLSTYSTLELDWTRSVEHLEFIREIAQPGVVVFRSGNFGAIEVILRARTFADKATPCPDVPFNCECVGVDNVFAACKGDALTRNDSAVLACPDWGRAKWPLDAATVFVAALAIAWASRLQWPGCGGCVSNPAYALVGFAIWWPANVIGDGMPLFLETGTNVAIATMAMMLGNIAVLLPLPTTATFIWRASAVGAGAIALSMLGGTCVEVAAFVAGLTGSAATCVVWGVAAAGTDADVKSLAVGMTLSAVVSSGAILVIDSTAVYGVIALLAHGASLLKQLPPLPTPASNPDEESLVAEESAAVASPPRGFTHYAPHGKYAVLYAMAYAIPGLLPTLQLSSMEYRAIIVAGTAGDVVGRIFAAKAANTYALPMAAAAAAMIGTAATFPIKLMAVTLFYAVRGDAVMAIQLDTKQKRPDLSGALGVAGQSGAVVGAAATAIALLVV